MCDDERRIISVLCLFHVVLVCFAQDSISLNQQLRDGQTLVSAGGVCELGFFAPNGSNARYVGVKFRKYPLEKMVWVANRDSPLTDSSGVLMIGNDRNLVIVDGNNRTIWLSNATSLPNQVVVVLLDRGNIVLKENKSTSVILWDSFDFPQDTYLPGMKFGLNKKTGKEWNLTPWKTESDPSTGSLVAKIDPQQLELPQYFMWNGSVKIYRSGQWTGRNFIGIPDMNKDYRSGYQLIVNRELEEIYFIFSEIDRPYPSVDYITSSGHVYYTRWNFETKEWIQILGAPRGPCDRYSVCGVFGICKNDGSPICQCLKGHEAKNKDEWNRGNWTGGCVRKKEFQCERNATTEKAKGDGFFGMTGIKTPDSTRYVFASDGQACEDFCLRNCTCLAYSYVEGMGCMLWETDLVDIQELAVGGGQFYLRLEGSELGEKKKVKAYVIVLIVVSAVVFLGLVAFLLCRRTKLTGRAEGFCITGGLSNRDLEDSASSHILRDDIDQSEGPEVQTYTFHRLAAATENFSLANKLGEGGFGTVYKGTLSDGQDIAVKRLSKSSGQGIAEFKTEVKLISKLQHRNLVKLLGFCIQGDEELLVYEYLPNKSLDSFIFGVKEKVLLNWDQRYNVIEGIARGLLYLHRDSRLKIIHRDLKTSNILLDEELNPKISDFGMARIFWGNQTVANTTKVVGTYGYMSPEYAMHGIFSEKSDVFSFGVLVLEIISGKRNNGFHWSGDFHNLLSYAYNLWIKDRAVDFPDPRLVDACNPTQVSRCINIGLLCVQEHVNHRPNMATTVSMLSSDMTLPTPNSPGFCPIKTGEESNPLEFGNESSSGNAVSLTTFVGR